MRRTFYRYRILRAVTLVATLLAISVAFSARTARAENPKQGTGSGGGGFDEIGNGGDGIVCRNSDGSIKSVVLLDLYEGENVYGLKPDMGPANWSVDKKVREALMRLNRLDPGRAGSLLGRYRSFRSNAAFVSNVDLVDVHDARNIVVPRSCRIEQAAIQRNPQFDREKRFTINQDLWEKMDNSSRAGLVVHELVYQDALQLGQTNSRSTRYFVAHLLSTLTRTMDPIAYQRLLVETQMQRTFAYPHGGELRLSVPTFWNNGTPRAGYLTVPTPIHLKTLGGIQSITLAAGSQVWLFDDGTIERATLEAAPRRELSVIRMATGPGCAIEVPAGSEIQLQAPGRVGAFIIRRDRGNEAEVWKSRLCYTAEASGQRITAEFPVSYELSGGALQFHWTGAPKNRFRVAAAQSLTLPVAGGVAVFTATIQLHKSGFVATATSAGKKSQTFVDTDANRRVRQPGSTLHFDVTGRLLNSSDDAH